MFSSTLTKGRLVGTLTTSFGVDRGYRGGSRGIGGTTISDGFGADFNGGYTTKMIGYTLITGGPKRFIGAPLPDSGIANGSSNI